MSTKKGVLAGLAIAAAIGFAPATQGQTLNIMRGVDAPHFDAHRTTWSPAGDIINMVQDTLWRWTGTARRRSPTSPKAGR